MSGDRHNCPHCGAATDSADMYCGSCGLELPAPSAPPTASQPPAPRSDRALGKWLVAGLAVLVALGVGIAIPVMLLRDSTPTRAVVASETEFARVALADEISLTVPPGAASVGTVIELRRAEGGQLARLPRGYSRLVAGYDVRVDGQLRRPIRLELSIPDSVEGLELLHFHAGDWSLLAPSMTADGKAVVRASRFSVYGFAETDDDYDEAAALATRIDSARQSLLSPPDYLLADASFTGAITAKWRDFTDWISQTELTEMYDQLYWAGFGFQENALDALRNADRALTDGDLKLATDQFEDAMRYLLWADDSFDAAVDVFLGNLDAGVVLAEGIYEGSKVAVTFGSKFALPAQGAEAVEHGYMVLDWYLTRELEGTRQANAGLIVDLLVDELYGKTEYQALGGQTFVDFANENLGEAIYDASRSIFTTAEARQAVTEVLTKGAITLGKETITTLINSIFGETGDEGSSDQQIQIRLEGDGLGIVPFGVPQTVVEEALVPMLGEPRREASPTEPGCPVEGGYFLFWERGITPVTTGHLEDGTFIYWTTTSRNIATVGGLKVGMSLAEVAEETSIAVGQSPAPPGTWIHVIGGSDDTIGARLDDDDRVFALFAGRPPCFGPGPKDDWWADANTTTPQRSDATGWLELHRAPGELPCGTYDVDQVELIDEETLGWNLTIDSFTVARLDNRTDGETYLEIAKAHSGLCLFMGRDPGKFVEFWFDGSPPAVLPKAPEDCIPYDAQQLQVEDLGNWWRINEGDSHGMVGLATQQEALQLLSLIEERNSICFVGRDNTRSDRMSYVHYYWR